MIRQRGYSMTKAYGMVIWRRKSSRPRYDVYEYLRASNEKRKRGIHATYQ